MRIEPSTSFGLVRSRDPGRAAMTLSRDITLAFTVAAVLSLVVRGMNLQGFLLLAAALVVFAGWATARALDRPAIAIWVDLVGTFSAILWVAWTGYGGAAPALIGLPLVVVVGFLAGGRRMGVLVAIVSLLALGGLLWAVGAGVTFPAAAGDARHAVVYLSTLVLEVLVLGGFLLGQDSAWAEVDRQLGDQLSELTSANRQLAQARDEALRANDAKSHFLASMSHELRTPLNAIIGYSEMLLDDPDPDGLEADLTRIRTSAVHLLALVSDVLDMSKVDANVLDVDAVPVDVTAIARSTVDELRPLAVRAEITMEVVSAGPIVALADPARFRQVLHNLLTNALRFAPGGHVHIGVRREGDMAAVDVVDDGCGMDDKTRLRCLLPFEKGERSVGGTGLGLAIGHRLCRLMGGDLTVESAPDQGSTFTVTLPLAPDATTPR